MFVKTANTNKTKSNNNFNAKNSSAFIQPKLNVGKPGDKYEVEADKMADQIVAKTKEPSSTFIAPSSNIQKQADEEVQKQEESTIQEKPLVDNITPVVQLRPLDNIQKQTEEEVQTKEDEEIQEKEEVQTLQMQSSADAENTSSVENNLNKGGGSPLESNTKNEMESGFGADFGGVRVHNDSNAVQMNKDLGSQAFTNGNDIYFNKGKYNTSSTSGKHLLAHELTHTIQQGTFDQATVQKVDDTTSSNVPKIQKQDHENADENQNKNNENKENKGNDKVEKDQNFDENKENKGNDKVEKDQKSDENNTDKKESPLDKESTKNKKENSKNGESKNGESKNLNVNPAENNTNSNEKGSEVSFPMHDAFIEYVKIKKEGNKIFFEDKKKILTDLIVDEKKKTNKTINDEIKRLNDTRNTSISKINKSHKTAKTGITTKRDTEIEKANELADEELKKVTTVIIDKKKLIIDNGENKATEVIQSSNDQGDKVAKITSKSINEVDAIIRNKTNKYKNKDNADDVTKAAWKSKSETVSKIKEAGNIIKIEVQSHANKLAENYRKAAKNIADKFNEGEQDAKDKIIEKRDGTVKALNEGSKEALDGLTKETTKLKTELNKGVDTQLKVLKGLPRRVNDELDDILKRVIDVVTKEEENTLKEINAFKDKVNEIHWHRDEVVDAKKDLEKAITEHYLEVENYVEEVKTKITPITQGFRDELKSTQDKVIPTISEAAKTYDEASTKLTNETINSLGEIGKDAEKYTKTVADDLGKGLQVKIDEKETEWNSQLTKDIDDMNAKVAEGLAEQANILDDFSSNLDTEFNRSTSWWDSVTDFFSGMLDGIIEGFTSLISALWDAMGTLIFWIVILVIVIIIVVLVVVFGVALALIGKVLLIVGIVVGVLAFIYFAARAIFSEGLTPYERGKLFGRGLFELAFAFIGTGVYARLVGWIPKITKIATIVARVGSWSRFLRIVAKVKDVRAFVRLIDKIGDLEALLKLMDKIKSFDQLIVFLENIADFERVVKVLSVVENADDLFKVLASADDVGKILSLIDDGIRFGRAENIISLLSKTKEISKLLIVFERSGDDFIKIIDLLENAPDLNKMIIAMEKVGVENLNNLIKVLSTEGVDIAKVINIISKTTEFTKLFKSLNNVDDVAKLVSILDEVNDINKLIIAFDKFGDANRLLRLFDNVTEINKLVELLDISTDLNKLIPFVEGVSDINKSISALKTLGNELDDFVKLLDEVDMTIAKLDKLLFMDNLSVTKLRQLLTEAGGKVDDLISVLDEFKDLDKLINYISHFGDFAKVKIVIDKARVSGMTIIGEFLETCLTSGFKKINEINLFFDKVVAHGSITPAIWREVIQYGRNFIVDSVGNTTKFGGRTSVGAGGVASKSFNLSDNSTILVTLEETDVLHMASRHTWNFFAMVMGNAKSINGMWPVGTTINQIRQMSRNALNSVEVQNLIRTMVSGENKIIQVTLNGIKHEARIALNGPNGMVSLYPLAGEQGIVSIPKKIIQAAIMLWKSI